MHRCSAILGMITAWTMLAGVIAAPPPDRDDHTDGARIAVQVRAFQAAPGLIQGILDLPPEPWPAQGCVIPKSDLKDVLKRIKGTKGLTLLPYPRSVVRSGTEASIRQMATVSVPSQPPQDLPVGAQIGVTPKRKGVKMVELVINASVSEVIGHEDVDAAAFPIVASSVWAGTTEMGLGDGLVILVGGPQEETERPQKFILVSAKAVH